MFYMESRHLLNLSVQNALHCISENFNHKTFRRDACARNSLERCAVRSPDGRYSAHIATIYYISRHPLSRNPPSAPGSILLDSFTLHGRCQKTVIACLYIHILKTLKTMNYPFLNRNFALKLQGDYWKDDVVTFTAHLRVTIKPLTRYKQTAVLASMSEGKSMPSNMVANTNHTTLLKNQSAIKYLPCLRYLSNFGCKIIFKRSVIFFITRIPSHCFWESAGQWPLSASGLWHKRKSSNKSSSHTLYSVFAVPSCPAF